MRWWAAYRRVAGVLVCISFAVSCASPSGRADRSVDARAKADERVAIRAILLPDTPAFLSNTYAHPPRSIRQAFSWGPQGNEWRLTILDPRAEYAGFTLRRPCDVSDRLEHVSLYMEISPVHLVSSLAVALIDGRRMEPRFMSVLPLEPYRVPVRLRAPRAALAIPLSEFEQNPVHPENGSVPVGRLDWSDIREIRIILPDRDALEVWQIFIHNMQFVPDTWIRTP